jgi:hypothetical protein
MAVSRFFGDRGKLILGPFDHNYKIKAVIGYEGAHGHLELRGLFSKLKKGE